MYLEDSCLKTQNPDHGKDGMAWDLRLNNSTQGYLDMVYIQGEVYRSTVEVKWDGICDIVNYVPVFDSHDVTHRVSIELWSGRDCAFVVTITATESVLN